MILKMFSICSSSRLKNLKFLKCLLTCLGFADKLPFIHELHSKVKEINLTIEKIMANRSKYSLEALVTFSLSSTDHGVSIIKREETPMLKRPIWRRSKRALKAVK